MVVVSACVGAVRVPLGDLGLLLVGRGDAVDALSRQIVVDIRLPRVVMGLCVGALLGVAGVLLQGFLRNPLAEPYLLGVSSGAALAVTIGILLNVPLVVAGVYIVPLEAFAGALVTLVAVYFLAQVRGRLMVTTLLLAGVVVGAFLSALMTLFATMSPQRYFEVIAWLLGHLQPASKAQEGWVVVYAALGLGLAWAQARDLNALLLGEEEAAALGVRVEKLKRNLFVLSSLLVGAAVSVSGLIGFVGLVAPHLCRLLMGPDHRWLIPASAVAGAGLLVLADLVSRIVVAPSELPVGVITALIGGPFFLFLLVRHTREIYGRRLRRAR